MNSLKLFLTGFALLFFYTHITAQNIAIFGKTIDPEGFVEHNFGKYKKGKKQHFWLEIVNESQQPMQIKSLELSCDCLSASALPPMPIPPGAKYHLRIDHNARHIGEFQTFAIIRSDAKNFPELWVRLSGNVVKR